MSERPTKRLRPEFPRPVTPEHLIGCEEPATCPVPARKSLRSSRSTSLSSDGVDSSHCCGLSAPRELFFFDNDDEEQPHYTTNSSGAHYAAPLAKKASSSDTDVFFLWAGDDDESRVKPLPEPVPRTAAQPQQHEQWEQCAAAFFHCLDQRALKTVQE